MRLSSLKRKGLALEIKITLSGMLKSVAGGAASSAASGAIGFEPGRL